jgi:hypothetical protein
LGEDIHRCSQDSLVSLGENLSLTDVVNPITYQWSITPISTVSEVVPFVYASDVLSDTLSANPALIYSGDLLGDSIEFYLTVTDANGCQTSDTVALTTTNFGRHFMQWEYTIEPGDSVYLNQVPNIGAGYGETFYLWQPGHGLTDSTSASGFWAKPETDIAYTASVVDEKGCSETAGEPTYIINVLSLGVDEVKNSLFSVYPNPAKDELKINSEGKAKIDSYAIFDTRGLILSQNQLQAETINIEFLPSGIYLLRLHSNRGETQNMRFVKE